MIVTDLFVLIVGDRIVECSRAGDLPAVTVDNRLVAMAFAYVFPRGTSNAADLGSASLGTT